MMDQLQKDLERLIAEYECLGGVLILHKLDEQGQLLACAGLTTEQARECLAMGTFYNERAGLESEKQQNQNPDES